MENNFEKTKELMRQYREFDKRLNEMNLEVKRIDFKIERIDEDEGNIVLEDYEHSNIEDIKALYEERKEKLNEQKEAKQKEIEKTEKDKKFFRNGENLKTITMEIGDIDKEVRAQQIKLKENDLKLQKFTMETEHKNPIEWTELYKEKDSIEKKIADLNSQKAKYKKFLEELKAIELTPAEWKEMFEREEAMRKTVVPESEKPESKKPEPEQHEPLDIENLESEVWKLTPEEIEAEERAAAQKASQSTAPTQPQSQPQSRPQSQPQPQNITTPSTVKEPFRIKRTTLPEITIGRKLSIKDPSLEEIKDEERSSSTKKLLEYNKEDMFAYVKEAFKEKPGKLPKNILDELDKQDPVLIRGILDTWNYGLLNDDEVQTAILGVINKDKEALKDIIKIQYDKEDLSKNAFWPWNRKSRNKIARFAEQNREIAEVIGEYEPNPFKRLMNKVHTKSIGDGENAKAKSASLKNRARRAINAWKLTDEQIAEANSRTSTTDPEKQATTTQQVSKNEGR